MAANTDDLVVLQLETPRTASVSQTGAAVLDDTAANGAPAGEPEAWNANVAFYTPLQSHLPEPAPVQVSAEFAAHFNVEDYLAEERSKDLLRFSTAGSVDDGKSTLIGRLLYDTQSVYDDQIQSIEGKGTTAPGVLDLALLTDGLRAEREQGITIDVAYRYFSTAKRKFIIADTPGHEQYTRNMATGASTADAAVVLVDARKGVLVQSRRHAYITALLGVHHVVVAVNKMDLVGYSQDTFAHIATEFTRFFEEIASDVRERPLLHFVPVSALEGDNVVHASAAMSWYTGPTLLQLLETIPSSQVAADAPFRMAVQRVIRPNLDFRGFAGQIASGVVRVGDSITTLPSGKSSRVRRIVTYDGDLEQATAPLSITLVLEDEIDISRGDLLVREEAQPVIASEFTASIVWMNEAPLELNRRYLLKHGSRTVQAQVKSVLRTVDLANLASAEGTTTLAMNGLGDVQVETLQPIPFDAYATNRHTGNFVLIDPGTNATVAAGMIRSAEDESASRAPLPGSALQHAEVTLREGHTLHLQGSSAALELALNALREAGALLEAPAEKDNAWPN